MKKVLENLLGFVTLACWMLGFLLVIAMLGGLASSDFSTSYWMNYMVGSIVAIALIATGCLIASKYSKEAK